MPWYDIEPIRFPLARVFANDNSYCPRDEHAYFDEPGLTTPFYDEAHVSCTFTWDRQRAIYLQNKWTHRALVVKLGGPGFGSPADDFIPGRYVKPGVTFTTRGCIRRCPRCFVPAIEGKFRELPDAYPGNIIQDNNLMACSDTHWYKVMAMLTKQRGICFKGGIDARFLTDSRIADLATIQHHIAELFLACDKPADLPTTVAAIRKLKDAGFPRWKLRCYVIIGTDMAEEEIRLQSIWYAGATPFAELYKADPPIEYSDEWKAFQKQWCRPPATKAHMRRMNTKQDKFKDPDL